MISTLTGPVLEITPTSAVIDCGGVGYMALCPTRTLAQLASGQTARLYTFLHVREDALVLFGFSSTTERAFFEQLTSVSGVGPKIGLSLLSAFSPAEIQQAILTNQPSLLARASGVGKKLAEKIIVELKDKPALLAAAPGAAAAPAVGIVADVASALINLGYQPKAAEAAAAEALKESADGGFEAVFRVALRLVVGRA